MLPGASAFPPSGLASLTNAAGTVEGGGPTLKARELEVPMFRDGLNTSTPTRPACAISLALMVALRRVESSTLVGRGRPFQRSIAPVVKFLPLTVNVKSPPPELAVLGESVAMDGAREPEGRGTRISHMLLPCVPARRTRPLRCKVSDVTTTRGRPLPSVDQVAPASVLIMAPASVPM